MMQHLPRSVDAWRQRFAQIVPQPVQRIVRQIQQTAVSLHMPLYFVGGPVRDLILGIVPADFDMVVEGSGIRLGEAVVDQLGGELVKYLQFGTATWTLPTPVLPLRTIDFVTARSEYYVNPAALPTVTPATIDEDIRRRDFTINTMTLRLDGNHFGQLLDPLNGLDDLANGRIRILHLQSFVDDPTRMLRAIRFEQRLGFQLTSETHSAMSAALPVLDQTTGGRIWHELALTFLEPQPAAVMARLDEVGILPQLTPRLGWTSQAADWFARLPQLMHDPAWHEARDPQTAVFVHLAAWLLAQPVAVQQAAGERLLLPKHLQDDVLLARHGLKTLRAMPVTAQPSQIVPVVQSAPLRVLATWAALLDETRAGWIKQFWQSWRGIKTAVTGHDLRRLGLRPGPRFALILARLQAARLDGEVTTDEQERALLLKLIEQD